MPPTIAPPRRATVFIMVVTIIAFLLTLLGSTSTSAIEGALSAPQRELFVANLF